MFNLAFIFEIIGAPTFFGFFASFFGTGSRAVGGVGVLTSAVAETFSPVGGGAKVGDGLDSPNFLDSEVEEALLMPVATLE